MAPHFFFGGGTGRSTHALHCLRAPRHVAHLTWALGARVGKPTVPHHEPPPLTTLDNVCSMHARCDCICYRTRPCKRMHMRTVQAAEHYYLITDTMEDVDPDWYVKSCTRATLHEWG